MRKNFWLGLLAVILEAGFPVRAALLTGSFTLVPQGAEINLTTSGSLDWVHWGLYTDTSLDRKATVTPQIGNVVALSSVSNYTYVFQYADNYNGYSWNDGTPFPAVTNSTTGIWAYNFVPLESGFEFSVPADSSPKTLRVYVGAYNCRGRFAAALSDASAPAYTNTSLFNIGNGPGGVYTINFAADAPGQSLTVSWIVFAPQGQTANVTLQAATLSAAGANNPPYASILDPPDNATFPAPATITINAEAADADGSVAKVEFFANGNKLGEDNNSPFSLPWNGVPPGRYELTVKPTDNDGRTTTSHPIEIFVHGAGGSLSGSVALPPTSVDLTTEGTADWVHWGLVTNSSFNHKAVVQRKLSDLTKLGDHPVLRLADYHAAFNWSDGAPTLQAVNSPTGIFTTGFTNGFLLTAPADTNSRTLRVYVGLYGAEGEFQAYLSDFSAPAYADSSLSSVYGNSPAVYTINYAAAGPGQQLLAIYRSAKLFDFTYGNVALSAASLQGGPAEPLPLRIKDVAKFGGDIALSFNSQTGLTYTVEFTTNLPPAGWTGFATMPGNDTDVTVTNFNVPTGPRFYRVRAE